MTAPTAGALLVAAARRLRRVAGNAAGLEAEVLLGAALGRRREWLLAHADAAVPPAARRRFAGWLGRRITRREPVAYLTGVREFAGLEFGVGRGVLIPRPETEGLLERVELWLAANRAMTADGCVTDLGTGSGALAVALAKRTGVRVVAVDRSPVAVRTARHNAIRHGVDGLVRVVRGSWTAPILRLRPQPRVVVVMANPPYVSARLMQALAPEVRREPRQALAAGRDGLDAIREVARQARGLLVPAGLLAMEIGAEQGSPARRILGSAGWGEVRVERDLAGRNRYALAIRP